MKYVVEWRDGDVWKPYLRRGEWISYDEEIKAHDWIRSVGDSAGVEFRVGRGADPRVQHMSMLRQRVFYALRDKAMADPELVKTVRTEEFMEGASQDDLSPESSIRTRRAELVKLGLVRESGDTGVSSRGRIVRVWCTTAAPDEP